MSNTETQASVCGQVERQVRPLPDPAHRGPDGTGSYFDAYTADQMRTYAAAAVAAERERCAKACEGEAELWEQAGNGPAMEARLCAAKIRALGA